MVTSFLAPRRDGQTSELPSYMEPPSRRCHVSLHMLRAARCAPRPRRSSRIQTDGPPRRHILERLAGSCELGAFAAVGLEAADDDVAVVPVEFDQARGAAGLLGRDQLGAGAPNGSSTSAPRRVTSRIASATSATGFKVGCISSSSMRPFFVVLTPA